MQKYSYPGDRFLLFAPDGVLGHSH